MIIQQLPTKHLLLIGDHLKAEVCLLIEALQKANTPVNRLGLQ